MKKLAVVLFLSLLTNGCTVSSHFIQSNSHIYATTNPDEIKIFSSDVIKDNYIIIGSIAADVAGGANQAVKALKIEAAQIGADVIIDFKLEKMDSVGIRTGAAGVAVKISDES